MTEIVIVSAARTPVGSFNGALAGVSAAEEAQRMAAEDEAFADLRALTWMSLGIILAALAIQIMSPPPVAHSGSNAR